MKTDLFELTYIILLCNISINVLKMMLARLFEANNTIDAKFVSKLSKGTEKYHYFL